MVAGDDAPGQDLEEEKIPERLEKKWQQQEKKGLRAGVCKFCGWAFSQDEIRCKHCEAPTDMSEGVLVSLKKWFFHTPLGVMMLILIFAGLIFYLVR